MAKTKALISIFVFAYANGFLMQRLILLLCLFFFFFFFFLFDFISKQMTQFDNILGPNLLGKKIMAFKRIIKTPSLSNSRQYFLRNCMTHTVHSNSLNGGGI